MAVPVVFQIRLLVALIRLQVAVLGLLVICLSLEALVCLRLLWKRDWHVVCLAVMVGIVILVLALLPEIRRLVVR
jgi:hypothetical protein